MTRNYINIFSILFLLFATGCSAPELETSLIHPVDLSQKVDSNAFGNIEFGITRREFLQDLTITPTENRMTEPQFGGLVTEIEMPVTVGNSSYRGYYYFDSKDRLYKIFIDHQNEERLIRSDHDKAFESLNKIFEDKYGAGISLAGMPGLKSVSWTLKNKKIELISSCLASNCSMECTIIETNIFAENTIKNRVKGARLHLDLRLHPERYYAIYCRFECFFSK